MDAKKSVPATHIFIMLWTDIRVKAKIKFMQNVEKHLKRLLLFQKPIWSGFYWA